MYVVVSCVCSIVDVCMYLKVAMMTFYCESDKQQNVTTLEANSILKTFKTAKFDAPMLHYFIHVLVRS